MVRIIVNVTSKHVLKSADVSIGLVLVLVTYAYVILSSHR